MNRLATAAAMLFASAALTAPAAAAVTTFASFNPIGNAANFRWVGSLKNATFYSTATANGTTAAARNVNFSFLQPGIAPFVTNVTAKFLTQGTVTSTVATVSGATLTQTNLNGSFSFILTGAPITIGTTTFTAGSNLLSGTFTQATLSGNRGGTAAGLTASTPSSSIN